MPKDSEELEDIFDKSSNIKGLGRAVLKSLREKYGDGLEDLLYEGKCHESRYQPQQRREAGPYYCEDDNDLARLVRENEGEHKDSRPKKDAKPRAQAGNREAELRAGGGVPVSIDKFEKNASKKSMGKKQLTAILLNVISNLDDIDDDVFTMFYLQLSREFEKRFSVEGVCDTLNSALGVQDCVDVEIQKVAQSA